MNDASKSTVQTSSLVETEDGGDSAEFSPCRSMSLEALKFSWKVNEGQRLGSKKTSSKFAATVHSTAFFHSQT